MELVGKLAVLKDAQGNDRELVMVHGYYDAPVYTCTNNLGVAITWRVDLTRAATDAECVRYWKQRAERAEAQLRGEP